MGARVTSKVTAFAHFIVETENLETEIPQYN